MNTNPTTMIIISAALLLLGTALIVAQLLIIRSRRDPRPRVHLTDTELQIVGIVPPDDVIDAMVGWCRRNGTDAFTIPADALIVRRPVSNTVEHKQVVTDHLGRRVVKDRRKMTMLTRHHIAYLDHEPEPWPAEVVAFAEALR